MRLIRWVGAIALLPLTLVVSGGGIGSSSSFGSEADDEIGDEMSPAMRRAFEQGRRAALAAQGVAEEGEEEPIRS